MTRLFDAQAFERRLRARRELEEIEYWRKRAGWYDDDETMKRFNEGINDKYYDGDDDNASGGNSGSSAGSKMAGFMDENKTFVTFTKIAAVVIACLMAVGLYRMLMRRPSSSSKSRKGSSGDKSSRSRSKSASRSRSSRSRSRSRRNASSGNYDLMDDGKSDARSGKTSRSRSRSRKGRSSRSRSKSRSRRHLPPATKEVLV